MDSRRPLSQARRPETLQAPQDLEFVFSEREDYTIITTPPPCNDLRPSFQGNEAATNTTTAAGLSDDQLAEKLAGLCGALQLPEGTLEELARQMGTPKRALGRVYLRLQKQLLEGLRAELTQAGAAAAGDGPWLPASAGVGGPLEQQPAQQVPVPDQWPSRGKTLATLRQAARGATMPGQQSAVNADVPRSTASAPTEMRPSFRGNEAATNTITAAGLSDDQVAEKLADLCGALQLPAGMLEEVARQMGTSKRGLGRSYLQLLEGLRAELTLAGAAAAGAGPWSPASGGVGGPLGQRPAAQHVPVPDQQPSRGKTPATLRQAARGSATPGQQSAVNADVPRSEAAASSTEVAPMPPPEHAPAALPGLPGPGPPFRGKTLAALASSNHVREQTQASLHQNGGRGAPPGAAVTAHTSLNSADLAAEEGGQYRPPPLNPQRTGAGLGSSAEALIVPGRSLASVSSTPQQIDLFKAIINGNLELVTKLLNMGANPNYVDRQHNTPLNAATSYLKNQKLKEEMLKLLIQRGSKTTFQTLSYGRNAMFMAAALGEPGAFAVLLGAPDAGAAFLARDYFGWTVLHWAARAGGGGGEAILKMALDFFVDEAPGLMEVRSEMVFQYKDQNFCPGVSALDVAVRVDNVQAVHCLLGQGNAPANETVHADDGLTPLHAAISCLNPEMVEVLWLKAYPGSASQQKTAKPFKWKGGHYGNRNEVVLKSGLTAFQMVLEMERHLYPNSERMKRLRQIKQFIWKQERANSTRGEVFSRPNPAERSQDPSHQLNSEYLSNKVVQSTSTTSSKGLGFSKEIKNAIDKAAWKHHQLLSKSPQFVLEFLRNQGVDQSSYDNQKVVEYCKGKFVEISDDEDTEDGTTSNHAGPQINTFITAAQKELLAESPTAVYYYPPRKHAEDELAHLPCGVCGKTDDEGSFLLCDGENSTCENGCHYYCVGLSEVPAGDWFCLVCDRKNRKIRLGKSISLTAESSEEESFAPSVVTKSDGSDCARNATKSMAVRTEEKNKKRRVLSSDSDSCDVSPGEGRAETKMNAIEALGYEEEERQSQKRPDVVEDGEQAQEANRASRPRPPPEARHGAPSSDGPPPPPPREGGGGGGGGDGEEEDQGGPPPGKRRPAPARRGRRPPLEARHGAPSSEGPPPTPPPLPLPPPPPKRLRCSAPPPPARAAAATARCAVCGPVRAASEGLQGCTGCQRQYHPLCLGKEDKPGTLFCPVCELENSSDQAFFKGFAAGFFSTMLPGTPPDAQRAALWRALAGRLRAHAKTFARDLLALAAPSAPDAAAAAAPPAAEAEADASNGMDDRLETALAMGEEPTLLSFWESYLKSIIPDRLKHAFVSKTMASLSLKYVGNAKELSAQQVESVGKLWQSKAQIEKSMETKMEEWCIFLGQQSEIVSALKESYVKDSEKTVAKALAELAMRKLLMEHLSNKVKQHAAAAARSRCPPLRDLLYSKDDLVLALWPKDEVFYQARIVAVYCQGVLSADQARYDLEYTDGRTEEKKVAPERLLPIENQIDRALVKKHMVLAFFSAIENIKDMQSGVSGDDPCICKTMHSPKLLVGSNKSLAFEDLPSQSMLIDVPSVIVQLGTISSSLKQVRQQPGKGASGQPLRPAAVKRRRPAAVVGLPPLFDVTYHDPPAKMEYGVSEWRLQRPSGTNGGASSTGAKRNVACSTNALGAAAATGRRRRDAQRATTSRKAPAATTLETHSVQCLCRLRRADGSDARPSDLGFLQAVISLAEDTTDQNDIKDGPMVEPRYGGKIVCINIKKPKKSLGLQVVWQECEDDVNKGWLEICALTKDAPSNIRGKVAVEDRIYRVNGTKVDSTDTFVKALSATASGETISLELERFKKINKKSDQSAIEGKPAFFVDGACPFPLSSLEETYRDALLSQNNREGSSALCFCRIQLEEFSKAYARGFVDYMGPNQNLQIFDTFKELVFHMHAVKQEAGTGGQLDGSAEEKPGFVFILTLTRYHIDGKRDGLQMQVNTGRRHPPRRRGYDALNPLTIDTDSLLEKPVLFPKLIFALSTDDLHEGRKKAR